MIIRVLILLLLIIIIYGLVILLGSLDYDTENADYIITLGHALKNDEIDSVLRYRLKKTLKYLDIYDSKVILSGGITHNNTSSEAYVMKEYLIKNGISDKRIILEDKSIDTIENIKNCVEYIKPNSKVVIISSNYHILRAKMICKLYGLNVKGIGTYTPFVELIKHLIIEEIFIFVHYFRIKKQDD